MSAKTNLEISANSATRFTAAEKALFTTVGVGIGALLVADALTGGKVHDGLMRVVDYVATFLPGGEPSAPLPWDMTGPAIDPMHGDIMPPAVKLR